MQIINSSIAKKLDKVRMVGAGINEIIHISEALERAEGRGLDLVLVSDDVTPPVVKIQDQNKIEYEKKKARKSSQKHSQSVKEIQFKVNISDHDLATKISKIEKFISRGDKVKISVRLKGRERENPERAKELIEKVTQSVTARVTLIPGPQNLAILEPDKKINSAS